jgi:hypothetical protein
MLLLWVRMMLLVLIGLSILPIILVVLLLMMLRQLVMVLRGLRRMLEKGRLLDGLHVRLLLLLWVLMLVWMLYEMLRSVGAMVVWVISVWCCGVR